MTKGQFDTLVSLGVYNKYGVLDRDFDYFFKKLFSGSSAYLTDKITQDLVIDVLKTVQVKGEFVYTDGVGYVTTRCRKNRFPQVYQV